MGNEEEAVGREGEREKKKKAKQKKKRKTTDNNDDGNIHRIKSSIENISKQNRGKTDAIGIAVTRLEQTHIHSVRNITLTEW